MLSGDTLHKSSLDSHLKRLPEWIFRLKEDVDEAARTGRWSFQQQYQIVGDKKTYEIIIQEFEKQINETFSGIDIKYVRHWRFFWEQEGLFTVKLNWKDIITPKKGDFKVISVVKN